MSGITVEIDMVELAQLLNKAIKTLNEPKVLFEQMGEVLLDIHRTRFKLQKAPDGTLWKPLSDWYKDSKKYNQDKILTLRGHLRGTLRYQASDTGVVFGSDRPYAAIHQFGGTVTAKNAKALNVQGRPVKSVTIPARPWLGLSADDEQRLIEIARKHLKNEFNA